jgi:hypothetical protein
MAGLKGWIAPGGAPGRGHFLAQGAGMAVSLAEARRGGRPTGGRHN